MVRSRSTRILFFLLLLVAGSGAMLVFKVPVYKQLAKRYWHDLQRPDVPAIRTEFTEVDGVHVPKDPMPFAGASTNAPNLHFLFPAPGYAFSEKASPAIIRVVKDVADSLISISAGITFASADPAPDLRICIRIDHADGSPVEWNEKRLLTHEHCANAPERLNFEWLLRDLPVQGEDRIAVILRNPDRALVTITDMDVVFRSAAPLRTRPRP